MPVQGCTLPFFKYRCAIYNVSKHGRFITWKNLQPSGIPEADAVLRDAIKGTVYNQSETTDNVQYLCDLAA